MYSGKCLIAAIAMTLFVGCAAQSGSAARSVGPRDNVSLNSVNDLVRYSATLSEYDKREYTEALRSARTAYESSGSDNNQLRLAIALMHHDADDALRQYREAEKLLNDYIKNAELNFFDSDYRAFAQLMLNMNRSWQRMHGQLAAARVETADARKKLEELKSIEMRLNHPGQRFQ